MYPRSIESRILRLLAPTLILCLAIAPATLAQAEDAGGLASTREAAEAHHRAGETEKAVEAWRSLINRSDDGPTLAVAYNELGYWLLARDGERETLRHAEACFLEALDLSGGRANRARLNLAEVLRRQGHGQESANVLASVVAPELARPWRGLRLVDLSPPVAKRAAELRAEAAARAKREAAASRPSATPGVQHVGGDVIAPKKLHTVPPEYTPEARQARIQGVVIVQAIITETGRVASVKVLKGLPMGLSEKAVEAVRKWRFEPATLNGEPVEVYYNFTLNFRL